MLQSSKWVNIVFQDSLTSLVMSILFSIVWTTALEYITGFLLERIFNCKWWDYSDYHFNLKGYICLQYSLLWGLLAVILIQMVHPVISKFVFSVPLSTKGSIATVLLLYFVADTVKSIIDALNLREVILNYSNLPVNKYYEKITQYKRFFLAFPRLLILNAGVMNRDVRSILNDRIYKIKVEIKSRFR